MYPGNFRRGKVDPLRGKMAKHMETWREKKKNETNLRSALLLRSSIFLNSEDVQLGSGELQIWILRPENRVKLLQPLRVGKKEGRWKRGKMSFSLVRETACSEKEMRRTSDVDVEPAGMSATRENPLGARCEEEMDRRYSTSQL